MIHDELPNVGIVAIIILGARARVSITTLLDERLKERAVRAGSGSVRTRRVGLTAACRLSRQEKLEPQLLIFIPFLTNIFIAKGDQFHM